MARDQVYLLDILEAAILATSYVEDVSEMAFLQDTQRQDSVIRCLEISGEAARRISPEVRNAHPTIPWSSIIGMRNFLIHDYDDVDLRIVWQTVQQDLPNLIAQIKPLIPPTNDNILDLKQSYLELFQREEIRKTHDEYKTKFYHTDSGDYTHSEWYLVGCCVCTDGRRHSGQWTTADFLGCRGGAHLAPRRRSRFRGGTRH